MAVITISRQTGSLGFEISKQVAELLGYRIVWRELINQAALRCGAPEIALAVIDELGLLKLYPSSQTLSSYLEAVKCVMNELADHDNVVIVGRAGQVILRGRYNTMHVRIIAPTDIRAERIMRQHNVSLEAARRQISASDRYRKNYLKRFYQAQWDDPVLYDLILNSAHYDIRTAADLICLALKTRNE